MNFNKNLFNAVNGGVNFSSPTTGKISSVRSGTNAALAKLNDSGLSSLSPAVKTQIQGALNSASSQNNLFESHVNDQLGNAMDRLGTAQAVKQIDTYVDDVPASCTDTNNLLGSVLGAADGALDSLSGYAQGVTNSINSYLAGSTTLAALESALQGFKTQIDSAVGGLVSRMAGEQSLLGELSVRAKALSDTLMIHSLWKDPCAQAVMDQLLPSNIKNILQ